MREKVEFVIVNALVKVEKCGDEHSYLNIGYCIHLQSGRFIIILRIKSHLANAVTLSEFRQ